MFFCAISPHINYIGVVKLVKIFQSRYEAGILTGMLEEAGIRHLVKSDDCGGLRPELTLVSGVRVYVNDEDYQRVISEFAYLLG